MLVYSKISELAIRSRNTVHIFSPVCHILPIENNVADNLKQQIRRKKKKT